MTLDDGKGLIAYAAAMCEIDLERIQWGACSARCEIDVAIAGLTAAERQAFATILRDNLPMGVALNVESQLPVHITTKITFAGYE